MILKRMQYFNLSARDSDLGHWHFDRRLDDESVAANKFASFGITSDDYRVGFTEPGLTALQFGGNKKAWLPAAVAGVFDMASSSFSIGLIVRFATLESHTIVRKGTTGGSVTGWHISGSPAGKLTFLLGDGTSFVLCTTTKTVADNRWHYLEVVVDRDNDQVRIYIDGVVDVASPHDISAVTGSIDSAAADLEVGITFDGLIDEIAICSEVLTAAAVADRAKARTVEPGPEDPDFLHSFLPATNQDNTDLNQFLIPLNDQYLELREHADAMVRLLSPAQCPARFLPLIASNLGFELLEPEFATESERRQLLANLVWIYKRKGTRAAVEKIIQLLGFSNNWTVTYPGAFPLIANDGRCWLLSEAATAVFSDDFSGSLAKWNNPSNPASKWKIQSGRLVGEGDGSASDANALSVNQTTEDYHLQVDFEVLQLASVPTEFGVYLRYVDASNWLRIRFENVAGIDRLFIEKKVASVLTSTELVTLTGIADIDSGVHRLHVWGNHTTQRYTIGLNDRTLVYNLSFTITGVGSTRKGLWVNHDARVAFDDFAVETIDHATVATVLGPGFGQTTVAIGIADNSHPAYELAKEEYLKEIIPKYLPVDVAVTWPYWEGPDPS